MLIRSISGLRGIVNTSDGLTDLVLDSYASAFTTTLGNTGTVAVGFDGRAGGKRFYERVCESLLASGCDVLALGMVPTPTVMFAVEKRSGVVGGISVTASHNPAEWNGLKFINASGLFLDADENAGLWKIVDTHSQVKGITRGMLTDGTGVAEEHVASVLAIPFIDIETIKARKLRVVLDAVNASGSFIQQELLSRLGVAEVIAVAADGSGIFPHTPEPIPENLTSLCTAVIESNADLGIAVDPDADRCVLVTEQGKPFIEENTIVVAAQEVLEHIPGGQTIVVNLSTTRAIEDIATKFGAHVKRTPVGEINVAKGMIAANAIIGGEGSGGVIYPDVHTGRDSLVAVALALSALARSGGTLSALKASLPQYEIVKSKLSLAAAADAIPVIARIKEKMGPSATGINESDGLRMEFANTWVHIRSSNTEPVMRIIAEAPTKAEAEALIARVKEIL